jgi:hypothetical protein
MPCQLVFGRDIFTILHSRQIGKESKKENRALLICPIEKKTRVEFLMNIRLETPGILRKLSSPCMGPYAVTQVYNNGSVQIQKGIVSERVNIRQISPFQ